MGFRAPGKIRRLGSEGSEVWRFWGVCGRVYYRAFVGNMNTFLGGF